jgi:parallel beta-helix repeat protein
MRKKLLLPCISVLFLAMPSAASAVCNATAQQRDESHAAETVDHFVNTTVGTGQVGCFPGDSDTLTAGNQAWGSDSGTYNLVTGGKQIKSSAGQVAVIKGRLVLKDNGITSAAGLALTDLKLVGRPVGQADESSVTVLVDDVTLLRNNITNPSSICVNVGAFTYTPQVVVDNFQARRNRVHDCGTDDHDHGFYIENSTNAVISYNLIYRNVGRGVQLYPNADGSTIDHNIFWQNGENANFSGTTTDGGSAASDNNTYSYDIFKEPLGSSCCSATNVYTSWDGHAAGTGNAVNNSCARRTLTGDLGYDNTSDYSQTGSLLEWVPFTSPPADFTIPNNGTSACLVYVLSYGDIQTNVGFWPTGPPGD